jgi:predicted transposase YbfD/YdcC
LLTKEAPDLLTAVRAPWIFGDNLNWVFDGALEEDRSRIRKDNPARICALIRKAALNLLTHAPSKLSSGREPASASMNPDLAASVLPA